MSIVRNVSGINKLTRKSRRIAKRKKRVNPDIPARKGLNKNNLKIEPIFDNFLVPSIFRSIFTLVSSML
jgi:hypothetical protein